MRQHRAIRRVRVQRGRQVLARPGQVGLRRRPGLLARQDRMGQGVDDMGVLIRPPEGDPVRQGHGRTKHVYQPVGWVAVQIEQQRRDAVRRPAELQLGIRPGPLGRHTPGAGPAARRVFAVGHQWVAVKLFQAVLADLAGGKFDTG